MSRWRHLFLWLALGLWFDAVPASAQPRLKVVASFSILGDFVKNVGGDRVAVTTLVGADGDVHVYTPSPADVRELADARLLVVNGLGLEGWLPRLTEAAGGKASIVTATAGIAPIKAGVDADPHAWLSVANAQKYVANIRDALVAADPADADVFRQNAKSYLDRLEALDAETRQGVGQIPQAHRKVISTHDAFGYFADRYGIAFIAPVGVSTEAEPSARDIARIIAQVKTAKIPAVFLERIGDPRLMRRISEETGAKIGGTLYSDGLTGEKGDAPTYIDMVRHNIRTLKSALAN
jgi:zinc/manganese transport system substrate-binding protein